MLVARVDMHFSDRIDGKVTGCTWHSLAWRISFLLDHFDSAWVFSSTGWVYCLYSFLLNSILCSWKKNASSNWISPFLKVNNLVMHFLKVSVAFTAVELWHILKDSEKILLFLPVGSVSWMQELYWKLSSNSYYVGYFCSLYIKHYTM